MSREDILYRINYQKSQKKDLEKELEELEEKIDVLEEFSTTCASYIEAFEQSIQKRKNKLLGLEGLMSTIKSAAKYLMTMTETLTGKEYSGAAGSISELQSSISTERKKLTGDIDYLEKEIQIKKRLIEQLQYEYDTYADEEELDE